MLKQSKNMPLILSLAFTSGLCALVYQVYWIRELKLVFGATTPATAAVLTVFMGGLGLGSLFFGPRADRSSRPLRLYAQLELVVTLGALASPVLIRASRAIYEMWLADVVTGAIGSVAAKTVLAMIVLLVPSVAMGGTLPVLGRAVEEDADTGRGRWSLLYGINTLGAIFGAALPTLCLFEAWGAVRTALLACAINAILAVVAFRLSSEHSSAPESPDPPGMVSAEETRGLLRTTGTAAFLAGFAFLLSEIVWYRMLSPILGGTTYTFGLVLMTVLLGIGGGGVAYAFTFKKKSPSLAGLALVSALEAIALAIPFAAGDRIALSAGLVWSLRSFGFGATVAGWLAVIAFVVFPVAFLSGFQFPMLLGIAGGGRNRVGTHAGLVVASNMGGAVTGTLAGSILLVPALGAPGAWRLAVVSCLAISVLAWGKSTRKGGSVAVAAIACGLFAGGLLAAEGPTAVWRHSGIGIGNFSSWSGGTREIKRWQRSWKVGILKEFEGREASVAVLAREGLAFSVNGKIDGNALADAPTQIMLGLLGALLHPTAPRNALVIGLGTGSTAGWLAQLDEVRRVDVAEIEPSVAEFARMCAAVNKDAMRNPKVRVHVADGLEFINRTREKYDLIVSEPSNPYRAGIASLYTRDFYLSAARKLNPGGVFVQWLQTYDIDSETLWTILATLRSSFRHVEIWQTLGGTDLAIVATDSGLMRVESVLRTRIASTPYREALSIAWQAGDLEAVLARHVAGPALADRVIADGRWFPDTADRNRIEYGFARSVGTTRGAVLPGLLQISRVAKADRPEIAGSVDWSRVQANLGVLMVSANISPAGLLDNNDHDARLEALAEYLRDFDTAACVARWPAGKLATGGALERFAIADSLADLGRPETLGHLDALQRDFPADAGLIKARYLWRTGKYDEASHTLARTFETLRTNPWVNEGLASRALREMAPQIGRTAGHRGQEIANALAQPFEAYLLNQERLYTIIRVTPRAEQAEGAIAAFEPDFPWNEELLVLREQAYRVLGDSRARKAAEELAEFRAEDRANLRSFLSSRPAEERYQLDRNASK